MWHICMPIYITSCYLLQRKNYYITIQINLLIFRSKILLFCKYLKDVKIFFLFLDLPTSVIYWSCDTFSFQDFSTAAEPLFDGDLNRGCNVDVVTLSKGRPHSLVDFLTWDCLSRKSDASMTLYCGVRRVCHGHVSIKNHHHHNENENSRNGKSTSGSVARYGTIVWCKEWWLPRARSQVSQRESNVRKEWLGGPWH